VLTFKEKVLGTDHPDTAMILNNLAVLLEDHDDLAGSRPLNECGLAIWKKVLGREHPLTNRVRSY
jgi:hypothetical protein